MAEQPRKSQRKAKVKLETGPVQGAHLLRRVFPLLAVLAESGTGRDKAGNRQLLFSQYAALLLVGLFNPVLTSARSLVAASGLKKVRRLTGGRKVSLGSFSEASSVFDPRLLEGLIRSLRRQAQQQRWRMTSRFGKLPNDMVSRLVAVDASVLNALPQIARCLGRPQRGQWRLHAQIRVCDGSLIRARLTEEPAGQGAGERAVVAESLPEPPLAEPLSEEGDLLLMDRGYRSGALFNQLVRSGRDDVCRLTRTDGRVVTQPVLDAQGQVIALPPLADADRALGVVADELIMLGSGKDQTDHPVRRITVVSPADRPSSARQGRVRSDQGGRDELVLATTLLELTSAEIVLLYEFRWQIELFFRFLKHVLGCQQLLSAKTRGVEIQLYCALIASLLMALATGHNLSKRNFEMLCLYFSGWADEDEILEALTKPP